MAIVQCRNQHYYDTVKHTFCPYCVKSGDMPKSSPSGEGTVLLNETFQEEGTALLSDTIQDDGTEPLDVTIRNHDVLPPRQALPVQNQQPAKALSAEGGKDAETAETVETAEIIKAEPDAVDAASARAASDAAVCLFAVGWLVCTGGPFRGRGYTLRDGWNFAGSSADMDIILPGDSPVSHDRQFSIVYDPKGNRFYIVASGPSGTYINGERLKGQREITDGDRISAGGGEYVFIPFCKEGRTWQ